MSKLHAPLFSFRAHGRIHEQLQYQDSPSGARVQQAVNPAQPRTPAQLAQRARYRAALDDWNTRPAPFFPIDQWPRAARALGPRFSPMNAFLHFDLNVRGAGDTWQNTEWRYWSPSGLFFIYTQVSKGGGTVPPTARSGLTPAARDQSIVMNDPDPGFWDVNLGPYPSGSVVYAIAEYDDGLGSRGRSGLLVARTA